MKFEVLKEKIKQNKEKIIIGIIFVIAITLRFIYIIKTPYNVRQHDLGDLNSSGCLKYIYTIYSTGKLPTTNKIQFYHPPLHHLISAGFMKLCTLFTKNEIILFEEIQVLPFFYSLILLLCVNKILKELKFIASCGIFKVKGP